MGRQEAMLTLEPEDLPALMTQTLRAIEEVFFFAGFFATSLSYWRWWGFFMEKFIKNTGVES